MLASAREPADVPRVDASIDPYKPRGGRSAARRHAAERIKGGILHG